MLNYHLFVIIYNKILISIHKDICKICHEIIATLFFQLNMREIALPFDNIHTLDVDKFLSKTLKSIAEWISSTPSADINVVKILLDLLEHHDRYVIFTCSHNDLAVYP